MTSCELYWLTRLDGLNVALGVLLAVSGITVLLLMISYLVYKTSEVENESRYCHICYEKRGRPNEAHKVIWGVFKNVFIVFLFANVVWFIPTTKEAAVIYLLPRIANNERVQQLPDKLMTLVDDWIKELSPEKKKAVK